MSTAEEARIIEMGELVNAPSPAKVNKAVAKFFMLSGTPEEIKERLWNMLTDSLTGDLMDGEAARRVCLYKELVELLTAMQGR